MSTLSTGPRAWIAVTILAGVAARVTLFITAAAIAARGSRLVTAGAIATGVLLFLQRGASAAARAGIEHDLYRAAARALVESDVFDLGTDDVHRIFWEGSTHARAFVGVALPALLVDAVAAIAVAPFAVGILPPRVLVAAASGAAAVVTVLLAVRRTSARLQSERMDALRRVNDHVLVGIDGRFELVASGGEAAFARTLDATLAEYRVRSRRAALGATLLGRLALAAGVAAVALSAVADAAARDALVSAVLDQAVVLAAAAPIVLGVVVNGTEFIRGWAQSRPFVRLLRRAPREELVRRGDGAALPTLPCEIAASAVSFSYAPGARNVFERIDLAWPVGKALLLVGPNGSGKSTFLHLLIGLRAPTRGAISVAGVPLAALDAVALRRRTAFLPQRPYLGEAYASVAAALRLAVPDATDDAMMAALDRVGVLRGLRHRTDSPLAVAVGELSAGQRQRVALARILLRDAPIVFLDEPDANLDSEGIVRVARLVDEMVTAGKMVAVAAHSAELRIRNAVQLRFDA